MDCMASKDVCQPVIVSFPAVLRVRGWLCESLVIDNEDCQTGRGSVCGGQDKHRFFQVKNKKSAQSSKVGTSHIKPSAALKV
jgi:hypothetical protein